MGRHKILSNVAVFYVGLNSSDHAKVTQKIDQMQVVILSLEHIGPEILDPARRKHGCKPKPQRKD